MKTTLLICFLTLPLLAFPNLGHAQSTAFTYQGRLSFNGAPLSGTYDFQFSIYDASAAGNRVAGPLYVNSVNVVAGLFVTRLDFGPGIFTGPGRWLEVGFRPGGNGIFTTLDQRLELTSSPYSIRSLSAGVADSVAAGGGVKSLNGLHDDLILATDPTLALTRNGNTLTLSVPGGGGGGGGPWAINGNNIFFNAGSVGIGTDTPSHLLSLAGGPGWTANGWFGSMALNNGGAVGWKANTAGQRFGFGHTDGGFYMFRTASDPGTSGSSVTYDFSINDTGRASMPAGLNLGGEWDGNNGALTITAQKPTIRFVGGAQSLANWLIHDGADGPGDLEFWGKSFLASDYSCIMALSPFGGVGIGTTTPQSMLDIAAQDAISISGYQPFMTWSDVQSTTTYRARIQNAGGEFFFATDAYMRNNSSSGWARLSNSGNWNVATLTIRGGADLAEPFDISGDEVQKGSVMVIDPEHPGSLMVSAEAYDRRVAGVVSGAGGIHPGISLHQEGILDGADNIALSGRVYVLADAGSESIQPGDLLTTSATPGHAMKAADNTRCQGAILGKAMTGLKQGRGLVLVLVTLQ